MRKVRLKNAIESGKSDVAPEQVQVDNQCEFGTWLHSLSEDEKRSPRWEAVRQHHAEFHKTAASVLTDALAGNKAAATAQLDTTGAYGKASAALTGQMTAWKQALTPA
ncbi:MAG: CZB domain-containing protein [Acidimicrobiales bacterium]